MNNNIKSSAYCKHGWQGITLTNAAANRILQLINQDPNMLGLKIVIKKSGCAGFSYSISKVTYDSSTEEDIIVYERNGAKLFVPLEVMSIIDGTELDYVQEGLNYLFKFNNPQVRYSCGCGESFGV